MKVLRGRWVRPKKQEMLDGAKARIQHATTACGPKSNVLWVEGTLYTRGRHQTVFKSSDHRLEFDIDSTSQIEIWKE